MIAVVLVLLIILVLVVGLWGSHGGLQEFIAGQFAPQPKQVDRDISQSGGELGSTYRVQVELDLKEPVNQVSERYLSFALDTAQVVGGKWWNPQADHMEMGSGTLNAPVFDFNRPQLDVLVRGLSPAYFRIGGSEADKVYYALEEDIPRPPEGFESVLNREQWDAACEFALRNDLQLVFTLNVGPGTWSGDGIWDAAHAEKLLAYSAEQNCPVALWELGNELNAFWFIHGLGQQLSPRRYARALEAAAELVRRYYPNAQFTGQASAYWPVLGEPLGAVFPFQEGYLKRSGKLVDLVAWHYYPQQSRREPFASRRAHATRLLNPAYLDEAAYWAGEMIKLRDAYAPGAPIWMGESGNAQAGGEPGVSDVYIGGLWWLDQLGLLARHQHQVVIRQTLAGSNYGLLDDRTLEPRPDYWNSLLWKRLMGTDVFDVEVKDDHWKKLRAYAHSTPGGGSGVTLMLINLDHQREAVIRLPGMENMPYEIYQINTPDVLGQTVSVNGEALALSVDGAMPEFQGKPYDGVGSTPEIIVNPLSYSFVKFTSK